MSNSKLFDANLELLSGNDTLAKSSYEKLSKNSHEGVLKDLAALNLEMMSQLELIDKKLDNKLYYDVISRLSPELDVKNQNRIFEQEDDIQKFLQIEDVSKYSVSIVMPTYNRAYVIGDAIQSVLQQSHQNFELLVCDDASTDNTKNVVEQFNDDRIKYLKLEKGNGATARNAGLRKSTGHFIAFLDSDNLWHPDHLKLSLIKMMVDGRLISYSGFIDTETVKNDYIVKKVHVDPFDYNRFSFRNYIDLNTIVMHSYIFRKHGGFDPNLPRQQDWDLLTKYFSYFNPSVVEFYTVFYRRNIAWDQVTNLFAKVDVRSVVMGKNKKLVEAKKNNSLHYDQINNYEILKSLDGLNDQLDTVAIKISAPNKEEGVFWGDYHYADQLGKALEKLGWKYRIDCQDTWYTHHEQKVVNIVLRGRHRYHTNNSHLNFLWIISHPDRLASGEFEDYDHIFVASDVFAAKVSNVTKKPVTVLYQAVDVDIFKTVDHKIALPADVIFIGNSRKEYRTLVRWAIEEGVDFRVWGKDWEEFIDVKYIVDTYVPNDILYKYYGSCKILLNDHWVNMANNGFVSNRIFDASACETFVISDYVKGIEKIFGDNVVTIKNKDELLSKVNYYLKNSDKALTKAKNARELVVQNHTFLKRAETLNTFIKSFINQGGFVAQTYL